MAADGLLLLELSDFFSISFASWVCGLSRDLHVRLIYPWQLISWVYIQDTEAVSVSAGEAPRQQLD